MFGRRKSAPEREKKPREDQASIDSVLNRLDSVVNRLEGVYSKLAPELEEEQRQQEADKDAKVQKGIVHDNSHEDDEEGA